MKAENITQDMLAKFIKEHGRFELKGAIRYRYKYLKEIYGGKNIVAFKIEDFRTYFSIRVTVKQEILDNLGCTMFVNYSADSGLTRRYELSDDLYAKVKAIKDERSKYVNGALKEIFNRKAAEDMLLLSEKDKDVFEEPEDKEALERYLDLSANTKDKNIVYTTYSNRYSEKDKSALNKGRVFANKQSIQTLPKYIRNVLITGIDEEITDVDIVNCHPTIFLALAKKYGAKDEDLKTLNEYIADPKAFRHKTAEENDISYEDAKHLLLVLSYGSELKVGNEAYIILTQNNMRPLNPSESILTYKKELQYVSELITKQKEHIDFLNKSPNLKTKKTLAKKASAIVQLYESLILTEVERKLTKEMNTAIYARMFDGLIVYGNISQNTLNEISKELNKTMKKYFKNVETNIKLEAKNTWNVSIAEIAKTA